MRIFTPGDELPMAGHPTIGSTFALAHEGTIPPGQDRFRLRARRRPDAGVARMGWRQAVVRLDDATPAVVRRRSRRIAAAWSAAIGVEEGDLAPDLPLQVVSCGVPFLFVPLRSRAAVDRVSIDRHALTRCYAKAGIEELPVFVFTTDGAGMNGAVPRRSTAACWRPASASPRIPPPAAPAVRSDATWCTTASCRRGGPRHRQPAGCRDGRPSRIHISIDARDGGITRVRVGGRSVLVGEGELYR